MPRQQRYRIPDIPQHVIARGNDRRACFFDPSDYRNYLELLREASARHRCEIHAYVLMTNHVYLLVTPRVSDGISRMMQAVGRRYVQQMNAPYGRTGTLWQGRYVELNPVRAGMGVGEGNLSRTWLHQGDSPGSVSWVVWGNIVGRGA